MLHRAFLLLSTSFFLAMDGTMAQGTQTEWTTGKATSAISVVTDPSTNPPTSTTYLDVSFFHNLGAGSPNNKVSYYYAGCINALPAITGLTDITSASYTTPVPAPVPSQANSCGVAGTALCAAVSKYSYKLQDLNAITNTFIKSGTGTSTDPYKVKFCVRHSLYDTSIPPFERGYKEADVEVRWESNTGFDNVVTTTENGPEDVDVDVGDVSVKAELCDTSNSLPPSYNQGERIQICLTASVTGVTGGVVLPRVVIVEVNELRFWIDNPLQGINNVYDDGEVTQVGITTSSAGETAVAGTTTVIPTDVIGTGTGKDGTCDQPFAGYALASSSPAANFQGCVLTTFLGPLFFPATGSVQVKYAGRVTVQFSSGNRRSLALKNGDMFGKSFGSDVTVVSRATEDDSCECGGFFFLICMIMCFISSLFG